MGRVTRSARGRARARHGHRMAKGGPPGGAIALLVACVVLLAVLWMWMARQKGEGESQGRAAAFAAAERLLQEGDLAGARAKLENLDLAFDITPEERARRATLIQAISDREAKRAAELQSTLGSQFLYARLQTYEKEHLGGYQPDPVRVRLLLKRCAQFKERWPSHPDLGWVEREAQRYEGVVSLEDPPSAGDVAWEVQCLKSEDPPAYREAFEVVDAFLSGAFGRGQDEIKGLRIELVAERAKYHGEGMQTARIAYEKGDTAAAVRWLVYAITELGDKALANESAAYLSRLKDVGAHLRGVRSSRPDVYEKLMRNETFAGFVRAEGI